MSADIEQLLFVANKIPAWVEKHKDKFNKLVYKSLKQQNRLYEVAMQKMLFGSLGKDLQDQIRKETRASVSQKASKQAPKATSANQDPKTVLYIDGAVPEWIEKYRSKFSSIVYKSLKAQGKLTDQAMQKMLFGSLSQELKEKIQEEVESAQKATKATASPSVSSGGGGGGGNTSALLSRISAQLAEIITLLKK